jgi:hypothetical protein
VPRRALFASANPFRPTDLRAKRQCIGCAGLAVALRMGSIFQTASVDAGFEGKMAGKAHRF